MQISRLLVALCGTACVILSARAAESHSTNTALAADLKKFKLAPGLKAEVVAAEPLLQNPVAFSIDGRGRYFIAESHRWATSVFDITQNTPWLLDDLSFRTVNDRAAFLARQFATNFAVLTNDSELIRLVEDRDGDGVAETSSVFADGFRESTSGTAAGVLAQGTNVWFTSIPDLWRFTHHAIRITNGPSVTRDASSVKLASGLGVHISVSGHDVHGLIRGHDGRIYFSFGDRGVCVTNREGAVLNVPDTGGVLRCEPDGRNLEIFCTGLRNPQELAFDDYGNLWTVDNDTAGADPCRVLHLVEGGDYGWRASYQHMKGFGPWVSEELWRGGLDGILPPAGTVSQGPAGLAFYSGTGLTPQLAGKFVHADFPGGIWAYSVKPRGASFELADKEKILWNCWPTDVDFGPDGALYVLDWVESWVRSGKGRIYRLTANDQSPMTKAQLDAVSETRRLLGEGMTNRGDKELLALLGHADRRVRLEAQWELVERGTNSLSGLVKIAIGGENQFARLHALWALVPVYESLTLNENVNELASLMSLLEDADTEIRAQAALFLGRVSFFNAERPTAELLFDASPRVRLFAVQAYTARWPVGRRRPARIHVSRYQRIVGGAARQIAKAIGKDAFAFQDAVGAGIAGKFPAREFNELLPRYPEEPFLAAAIASFLASTRRNTAFESNYAGKTSTESALALIWAIRRVPTSPLKDLLFNTSERLSLEAVRAINDTPVSVDYPALASLLEDPRFRDPNWGWSALSNITPAGPFSANVRPPRDQVLLRALNANFRVGEAKNAEALVRFAVGVRPSSGAGTSGLPKASGQDSNSRTANAAAPEDGRTPGNLRAEALFLLGAWEVLPAKVGDLPIKPTKDPNHGAVPTVNPENWPGWFDRVVGLYRPLPPRPADDARRALAPQIAGLLSDTDQVVAQAALDAAVKLRLTNAAPTMLSLMRSTATPVSLRKQIPGALAALNAMELGEATKLALAESDPAIRAAALPHLGRLRSDEAVKILSEMVAAALRGPNSQNDVRLAQAAFAALGGIASTDADAVLRAAMKRLVAGELNPAFELELVEAAARRSDPEIKSSLASFEAARAKDAALGSWRSVLNGGDAERGKAIFFEKVEVQCSRCHAVKGQGGIVGPRLDGIGKQRTREYLLESIVFPNRAVAAGYENVTLTLKNGAVHFGLVKGEDEKELRVESPEDGALRVAKADIVTRQRGLSAMPEGLAGALSRRELRDVVEYLAGLK